MVKALEQEQESYRSRLFHFKGMYENAGRHAKSLSVESAGAFDYDDDDDDIDPAAADNGHDNHHHPNHPRGAAASRSVGAKPLSQDAVAERPKIGSAFVIGEKGPRSRFTKEETSSRDNNNNNAKETHNSG